MNLRVYEALFQFNQGMDQALESLNLIEKLELASPEGISRVRSNLSELPTQPEQPPTISDSEQENQGGGTPR